MTWQDGDLEIAGSPSSYKRPGWWVWLTFFWEDKLCKGFGVRIFQFSAWVSAGIKAGLHGLAFQWFKKNLKELFGIGIFFKRSGQNDWMADWICAKHEFQVAESQLEDSKELLDDRPLSNLW